MVSESYHNLTVEEMSRELDYLRYKLYLVKKRTRYDEIIKLDEQLSNAEMRCKYLDTKVFCLRHDLETVQEERDKLAELAIELARKNNALQEEIKALREHE